MANYQRIILDGDEIDAHLSDTEGERMERRRREEFTDEEDARAERRYRAWLRRQKA